ncbi:MAG TPA: hypothetical protein VJQ54_03245 [Candidatus Sulfotelmatobacter sp.]|nr:hypothetical protein [Candidatus Sulfotelmatobacter sp.]
MADSAEMLRNLYAAGFDIQTFERFPRAIGISKGDCIALLEPDASTGLRMIGRPGWRIGDGVGVLTSQAGRRVFQSKGQVIDATSERLMLLGEFERELVGLLDPQAD